MKSIKNKPETILDFLDRELENFYQRTGNYPNKIIMNKKTKDKIFIELENEPVMDNSWKNKKDNYRGIFICLSKNQSLKLE